MLASKVFYRSQPLRRAFSLSATPIGGVASPQLPWYPPAVASQRKKIINSVVVGTPVGATPPIPPTGYLAEEHRMWSLVYERVHKLAEEHACYEYMHALTQGASYHPLFIPDVKQISNRLHHMTGWRVAPVTGSLSALDFFAHLAEDRMPCTMYIRPHNKFAFTEDPDCVHEMLGHIPALFIPSWSRMYKTFGETAKRLLEEGKSKELEQLTLMYFAVVEKGLTRQGGPDGPAKAIGASVISGTNELLYAMEHPHTHLPLEIDLVMKYGSTDEDGFMEYFFVGESVDGMADMVVKWMRSL